MAVPTAIACRGEPGVRRPPGRPKALLFLKDVIHSST
jgi:hypothetical protein